MSQIILNEQKELGQKQREQIRRGFKLLDSRKKGKLPKSEAATLLRAIGQTPQEEELNVMFRGEPSLEQFESIFKANYKPPIENQGQLQAEIEQLLKVFDLGGNGLINKQQFVDVMSNMG